MPQTQATTPTKESDNYTAIDPQKQPLEFIIQNKDAILRMPEKQQMRFIDMAFRRYALPRYQRVNKQFPLDEEEISKLRTQFAARMLGLEGEPTNLKEPGKKDASLTGKAVATIEGAGSGVLGGIRTIADLNTAINKHLGPVGMPSAYLSGKASEFVSKKEDKAYQDAKAIDERAANRGAAVGHQIPAAIAAEGAGSAVTGALGTPTTTLGKVASGAVKGGAEGATFGAATPGGDVKGTAAWGAVLGGAFPLLGAIFGRASKGASTVEKGAAQAEKVESPSKAAPKTMEDIKAEIQGLKEKKVAEREARKAELKAKKEGKSAAQTATTAEKAKEAEATAAKQASQRATSGGVANQATASQAVTENQQIKIGIPQKGGINVAGTEKAIKGHTPPELAQALRTENFDLKARLKPGMPEADRKVIEDRIKENEKHIAEYDKQDAMSPSPVVVKVPEGQLGKKVRAKEGQPASPAQQAADRERMAKRRAEGKAPVAGREVTGGGVAEKIAAHVDQQRARFSVPDIGIQQIPEIEDAVKELEGGDMILKEMQKYRKAGKISDEEYTQQLKEWLLTQFGKE